MGKFQEIEAFLEVARQGSFAGAGREIGISGSYVSRLLTRLEDRLGSRLLQRTTRSLQLTPAGEQYLEHVRLGVERIERAADLLQQDSKRLHGGIRLTAPTGLGLQVLAPILNRFVNQYPEVQLSVSYVDRMVDLVNERFDFALRAGPLGDSSLRARRLASYPRHVVASPALIETIGTDLDHPDSLSGLPAMAYSGNAHPVSWTLFRGNERVRVRVQQRLSTNSGRAAALGAADGLGLAFLPSFHTRDLQEEGRLVTVVPGWGARTDLHVLFPARDHLPNRVRALIDFIAAQCASRD